MECGTVVDKSVVEINEAKKFSQLLGGLGKRKIDNDLYLLFQGSYAILAYAVAKEIWLRFAKFTLVWIDDQSILAESGEKLSKMLLMFFKRRAWLPASRQCRHNRNQVRG